MTAARTPKAPAGALCVVTINHHVELAMPMGKGLALLRLLSGTLRVERDWSSPALRREFFPAEENFAELQTISPDQIVSRRPAAGDTPATAVRRLK